jgi:hypothetical protein
MPPLRIRQLPNRRPILIATKAMLFMEEDTDTSDRPSVSRKAALANADLASMGSESGFWTIQGSTRVKDYRKLGKYGNHGSSLGARERNR